MYPSLLLLLPLLAYTASEPTWPSFLQQNTEEIDRNPLGRDVDDQETKKGDEAIKGKTQFVLVTTFDTDIPGSGKVWVVPTSTKARPTSFVLIAGLQTPTGLCFDKNHDFLYVCDPGQGRLLQFEIDRGSGKRFVLKSDQVATIVQGAGPTGCDVDRYGNLVYVDLAQNVVGRVEYTDLWSGFVDMSTPIYRPSNIGGSVSQPMGVSLSRSKVLYFINSQSPEDTGLLNSAAIEPSDPPEINILLRNEQKPWGLGLSEKLAYYTTDEGTVWAYSYEGEQKNLYLKSGEFFESPRGVCYGGGDVYIADFSLGEVFTFPDNRKEEVTPQPFVRVSGAYGLACINN